MRINWEQMKNKTTDNGFIVLDYKKDNKKTYVYVICPHCGSKTWKRTDVIKNIVSCGCYNREHNYIKKTDFSEGYKVNMLTVLYNTDEKKDNEYLWKCRCDCGKEILVKSSVLKSKMKYSCGCENHNNFVKSMIENSKKNKKQYYVNGTNIETITRNKLIKTNTSGVNGVTWRKDRGKWQAQICFKGKNYFLGYYDDKNLAKMARTKAEEYLLKDFVEWYKNEYKEEWEKLQQRREKKKNKQQSNGL